MNSEAMLTPRETEILKLIVKEYSTRLIAEMLKISPRTVDTHRKHILNKTGSKSVVGLIRFAYSHKLVD
jgi:DNA-binding CsgD family transcriptional regulator